ncbi:MAG TPA: creatininase family protein [Clostridia bacterium]|nr:creatininase family protein [Clostridia bacterium]
MERRYQYLRPAEIAAIRQECPIVYIPLGILEWHGVHNPIGSDALQAENLAIRCAQKGGLAFPPLYYGEVRPFSILEGIEECRLGVAEVMGVDPDKFLPAYAKESEEEQEEFYIRLLTKILDQARAVGFKIAVLLCGHYPLIDPAKKAQERYNKSMESVEKKDRMLVYATLDYTVVEDQFENAGDHAAGWETSHMLAICPDRVDLSLLPKEGKLLGIYGKMHPLLATAEYGNKIFDASAEKITATAKEMLKSLIE